MRNIRLHRGKPANAGKNFHACASAARNTSNASIAGSVQREKAGGRTPWRSAFPNSLAWKTGAHSCLRHSVALSFCKLTCLRQQKLARPKRFELLTPRFVVWCSIQLSYGRAGRQNLLSEGRKRKRSERAIPGQRQVPRAAAATGRVARKSRCGKRKTPRKLPPMPLSERRALVKTGVRPCVAIRAIRAVWLTSSARSRGGGAQGFSGDGI